MALFSLYSHQSLIIEMLYTSFKSTTQNTDMDLSMIRQQSLINYSIHNALLLQNLQFQQIQQNQQRQFNMRNENDIVQPEKKKVSVN